MNTEVADSVAAKLEEGEMAAPEVADPDRTSTEPLLPFVAVPVLKDKLPLTPVVPASNERKLNAPLDVAEP